MEATFLQVSWFVLFGVLLIGYTILDGFDLGAGVLSLFEKSPESKRKIALAIGPVWDGNEVWLLTAGGALFAAFPAVYASVFSGFYLAFMLLLVFLILRAVALEFAASIEKPAWRRFWDVGFGLGSLGPSLLFGVALANIIRGLPLDAQGNYLGSFFDLLNPYALLAGLQSLAMFICHAAIYLMIKTEGDLENRMHKTASKAWIFWLVLFLACTGASIFIADERMHAAFEHALIWPVLAMLAVSLAMIPLSLRRGKAKSAFFWSSAAMTSQIAVIGLSLYPVLVPASNDPNLSLTIVNASSSQNTLSVMLIIAAIGMPLVIGYTIYMYRTFKGKIHPESLHHP